MKFSATLLLAVAGSCFASGNQLVGRNVCAGCHKNIAQMQATTAMALTWRGASTRQIPENLTEHHAEGPAPEIEYTLERSPQKFTFTTTLPGRPSQSYPITTTMGGKRHGLSFLFRVPELEGLTLPRAPLVEARYLQYAPHPGLALSPGFPEEKPANYETALGRVLTPGFEHKCLACHGEPRKIGSHLESGVTCENCHGPGRQHLVALAAHSSDLRISNPARLPVADQMQPCSQCHSGFSVVEDPLPDDLLISDQVTALKNSECWLQSGGRVTCTNCHNPHQDAPRATLVVRSVATCLGCHSTKVLNHAAICPVNRTTGCVGCHMPDESKPPLRVADHWIRVHPDKTGPASPHQPAWDTRVAPKHMWLRMIVVADRAKAIQLRNQISKGASFFELARANSTEKSSAMNGGFLGDVPAAQFDPSWASAVQKLNPGGLSAVVSSPAGYVFLQRMPRNFREEAESVYNKAMALRKKGERQESAAQLLEALKIYPHLLRALTYLGVTYGEGGNPQTGAAILSLAAKLYPQDAGAHFNLGVALGAMQDNREIGEYQMALEIDPDLTTAYLNMGAALYQKGDIEQAIAAYRKGIHANPLIASLHYSLGVALQQSGKNEEAQREFALASKIDPNVGRQ
jgi:predicted CXXCH cytochrome family protein